MRLLLDPRRKFQLGPAKTLSGADIPGLFLQRQLRFQNNHILCPADLHGLVQQGGAVLIGAKELPHPAGIPRRETTDVGICGLQVFGGHHSGTLFHPGTDHLADPTVQLHLGQSCRHKAVQFSIHGAVVDAFPDVHWLSPFPAYRRIFAIAQKGAVDMTAPFSTMESSYSFWNSSL